MHEVLVNRLGGLSLPSKSVVRLTDHPDMTLDVYRGRRTTLQQQLTAIFFRRFLCCVSGVDPGQTLLQILTRIHTARREPRWWDAHVQCIGKSIDFGRSCFHPVTSRNYFFPVES